MSFSIEVPAEVNPLNDETLFRALRSAASNDQHQIQTATKQLQNWETSSGFFSTLQTIYMTRTLPEGVRYLAILQLKNGIDRYWRKTAINGISKGEKELIRSRCLESCLGEPKAWLALQSTVVMARIVRYEFPHDWPDAISAVVENLRTSLQVPLGSEIVPRSLLALLFMIKELSTAKMQRSRMALQAAAPQINEVLFATYMKSTQKWMTFLRDGGDDEGGAIESMHDSLLALRILRRLIIQQDFPNRHEIVREIWSTIGQHFDSMLNFAAPQSGILLTEGPLSSIQRHLLQFAKLHLSVAREHPAAFGLLPGSIGLARAYWNLAFRFSEHYGLRPENLKPTIGTDGDQEEIPFAEKLALKGLLVLRACDRMAFNPIQTFKYQRAEDKEEKRIARENMQNDLYTPVFAKEIIQVLVTRFFVFTARDLKQWETEPDEWEKSQEGAGDDWEFSIRICSEKLFLDLIINYKEHLIAALVEILLQNGLHNTNDLLRKDSIFAAIGLAAPVLEQSFDFESFLRSNLAIEAQATGIGSNILRRRVAIVLGKWLPVREGLDRPLVYQIFSHLLNKNDVWNDQVVRVTAGRQLHDVIDPFEFDAEVFLPFAENIIGGLMAVIKEVELTETKLALLNTLSLLIIKMEIRVTPLADQIVSLLPDLWTQTTEEYILQQTTVGILSRLVTSLGSDSLKYQYLLVPLIQSSIDPASPSREYLLEDSMDLWIAVLEQTESPPSAQLVGLVQYLLPMFEVGSDTLRKALDITEAYILLIPAEMLSNASLFLQPFAQLLGNLKREAAGAVTHVVELFIHCSYNIGGSAAVETFLPEMISSSFLPSILRGVNDAYEAHQTSGPNRKLSSIDGIVETAYLSVVARLCICGPAVFVHAFESFSSSSPSDWLLREWFEHMDSISSPAQKKLSCLALTSLIERGDQWALSHLQSFMSMWTDVINELVSETEDRNGDLKQMDTLVYASQDELKPDGPESPATIRNRELSFEDPVHRVDVRAFIRGKLGRAIEECGGMDVFKRDWIQNVDKEVVGAFEDLGIF